MAFVGGFDFSSCRWDTPAHDPQDRRRIDPWGRAYPPYHDAQIAVDGDAAVALGELVRERWWRATGERLAPAPRGFDPWPRHLRPDFPPVDVGIARTRRPSAASLEVREIEALYLDAIAAARQSLYFENQYLTSSAVERRARRTPPTRRLPGDRHRPAALLRRLAEETTMGVLRARLLRRPRAADRHGSLAHLLPRHRRTGRAAVERTRQLLIVDDRVLRASARPI